MCNFPHVFMSTGESWADTPADEPRRDDHAEAGYRDEGDRYGDLMQNRCHSVVLQAVPEVIEAHLEVIEIAAPTEATEIATKDGK